MDEFVVHYSCDAVKRQRIIERKTQLSFRLYENIRPNHNMPTITLQGGVYAEDTQD